MSNWRLGLKLWRPSLKLSVRPARLLRACSSCWRRLHSLEEHVYGLQCWTKKVVGYPWRFIMDSGKNCVADCDGSWVQWSGTFWNYLHSKNKTETKQHSPSWETCNKQSGAKSLIYTSPWMWCFGNLAGEHFLSRCWSEHTFPVFSSKLQVDIVFHLNWESKVDASLLAQPSKLAEFQFLPPQ